MTHRVRRAPRPRGSHKRKGGLTLIELVTSIVVIGIALSGSFLALNRSLAASADPMLQQQAAAIAESFLEEIVGKAYRDPDDTAVCGPAEATRTLFDNVCDYQSFDETGVTTQEGLVVAGLESYRVRVAIDEAATLNGLSGSAQILRVDVRVNFGTRVDLTLSAYRADL